MTRILIIIVLIIFATTLANRMDQKYDKFSNTHHNILFSIECFAKASDC